MGEEIQRKNTIGFSEVVDALDTRVIDRNIRNKHIEAHRAFGALNPIVNDIKSLMRKVLVYFKFHNFYVLGRIVDVKSGKLELVNYELGTSELQKSTDLGEAIRLLDNFFRNKGGWKYCCSVALSGYDGGIYTVIDGLAHSIQQEEVDNYVRFALSTYVPNDFASRKRFAQEYLDKYGSYLKDINISAEELATNLEALILSYVEDISKKRSKIFAL